MKTSLIAALTTSELSISPFELRGEATWAPESGCLDPAARREVLGA